MEHALCVASSRSEARRGARVERYTATHGPAVNPDRPRSGWRGGDCAVFAEPRFDEGPAERAIGVGAIIGEGVFNLVAIKGSP